MKVVLGQDPQIGEGSILGCRSGREIALAKTAIGDFAVIRSNTVIYCNVIIGDSLVTGHNVVIREENVIGNHFRIWDNSTVDYGCEIGSNVCIQNSVYVAPHTTIGDDVLLGPGVIVGSDPDGVRVKGTMGPTIKRGARIGANATVLPHVVIGEYSVVGAGSVVTEDVPAGAVAFGNPAKLVRPIDTVRSGSCVAEPPKPQTETPGA